MNAVKFPVLFLASFVYLCATAVTIIRGIHRFELIGLALQFAVLLPAVYYVLHSEKGETGAVWSPKPWHLWFAIGTFVLACLGFSSYIGQGIVLADESAYKFQAELFASLQMKGSPPPGATATTFLVPGPLAFQHFVLSNSGWFSKYPIGWPLALAIPEKNGFGWAATPILGGVLLVVVAMAAKEAFGEGIVFPSVWMAVLSPYVLSYSTGRLSHALCAVLVALAVLFYLRGIRTNRVSQFALMFVAVILSYHVRPFTAFIVNVVLCGGLILHYLRKRSMLMPVLGLSFVAGVISLGSVLLYNQFFTGHMLTSPYTLYDGPGLFKTSPMSVIKGILITRRYSIQATLLYSFPFVFPLAAYGYWTNRRSPNTRILAAIFLAIFLAHFWVTYSSASIVGERYYYEGYFSVLILAAVGLQALFLKWHTSRIAITQVAVALTLVQIGMSIVGADEIARAAKPYREIRKAALAEQNCHCAVFLKSTEDLFYNSTHFNLNTPSWKSAGVFYLNDPGPDKRNDWAKEFGWDNWVVLSYDQQRERAVSQIHQSAY